MIDLHSHVLPGLDDGPGDVAAAVAMARAVLETGTTRLAATPHIDRHFRVAPAAVALGLERMREVLAREQIGLDLVAGGEIALDRLVDLDDGERRQLGLGTGPCLLVEAPLSPAPGEFEWPIRALLEQGTPVLLAHPERSPAFQRSPGRLRALIGAGVLIQVTTGSIRGDFGTPARQLATELAREGLIHNVASDAHDVAVRPPGLMAAHLLADWLPGGNREVDYLLQDAPAAILAGEPLPPRPGG